MTNTAVAPTNAAAAAVTSPTKTATNTGAAGANGATGTSSTGASSISINGGLASLAGNFQSFLSLLTTQLQNQDPLNPTDTNQFTQQITQMTGVEQQLISNQLLQQLVTQQTGIGAAAGMIGDTVTAPGAKSTDPAISGTVTAVSQ
jgi:flagellar basal-body rod modification protein FlgD